MSDGSDMTVEIVSDSGLMEEEAIAASEYEAGSNYTLYVVKPEETSDNEFKTEDESTSDDSQTQE
jgi:hypothetical protein